MTTVKMTIFFAILIQFFPAFTELAKLSSMILNTNCESRHPCHIIDLREKALKSEF